MRVYEKLHLAICRDQLCIRNIWSPSAGLEKVRENADDKKTATFPRALKVLLSADTFITPPIFPTLTEEFTPSIIHWEDLTFPDFGFHL